ncbi:MAG: hypothetical protein PVJ09_01040 [Candidatus Woesebacteria bacterium]|jgi:hypothetical protein
MKNKKIIAAIVLVVALVLGGVLLGLKMRKPAEKQVEEKPKKARITEPVNVIDVKDRPYIQISPLADGRYINLIIKSLKKPATSVEYELEYLSGSLVQLALDEITLDELPSKAEILFGTCSTGGKCSYHTDIKGGSILTSFKGGDEKYALKSQWKYFENTSGETDFSSKDAKFQISSKALAKQRYIVIFNSAGYPEELEYILVSDPYSLATSADLSGKADLSIRAQEEGELMIMGWDGKKWVEFETEIDSEDKKMAKAEVELMELYLVVKK